jgi:glycosidase
MQWDGTPMAGFTTGRPWLRVSDNVPTVNVQRESNDPSSLLNLYRRLIRLRKETPALTQGTYHQLESSDSDCLVFLRHHAGDGGAGSALLVAVNFSSHPVTCAVPDLNGLGRLLLSTREPIGDRQPWRMGQLDLEPDEAVIISLHTSQETAARQSDGNFARQR